MKIHTTNYYDTLVEIAEDCPATEGTVPPQKGDKKSIANYQYEMLIDAPYQFTSDDVFFSVYAVRRDISEIDKPPARKEFFAKGQPCFRASPLTKRYGWGVHSNGEGKVAIYGVDSEEYRRFLREADIKKVKAMKSKR